ncbi:MAG: SAM-dependent methyltransferase [Lachnospiraceae bacterium]|nr:SAM-dependent methyltransferase [Lachnospiraceae bacterium]
MEQVRSVLDEWIDDKVYQIILSNVRGVSKSAGGQQSEDIVRSHKVKVRPVLLRERLCYQETVYRGTQVFHSNCGREEIIGKILHYLENDFRQGEIQSARGTVTILISKKGKPAVRIRKSRDIQSAGAWAGEVQSESASGAEADRPRRGLREHNRVKNYILEEGVPVEFLIGLGVQTREGKIVKARYDKFRQINRYLEFVEDVIPVLPRDRTLRIIDFGCGKSYLTFALYYYLHEIRKYPVDITGLDLKDAVIRNCNALAEQYGYENLHFEKGDISAYEGADSVDMVVSLHACDTATDYALYKAIKWGASVIFAVPCCQHEVNRQIHCEELSQVLGYGLIRERMSALITDAVRAKLLEENGYDTQILEFIDMEHTPKNILIRAVKGKGMRGRKGADAGESVREICDFLHISPTLQGLLERSKNGANE